MTLNLRQGEAVWYMMSSRYTQRMINNPFVSHYLGVVRLLGWLCSFAISFTVGNPGWSPFPFKVPPTLASVVWNVILSLCCCPKENGSSHHLWFDQMGAHLPKAPLAVVTCLQCPYLMKVYDLWSFSDLWLGEEHDPKHIEVYSVTRECQLTAIVSIEERSQPL